MQGVWFAEKHSFQHRELAAGTQKVLDMYGLESTWAKEMQLPGHFFKGSPDGAALASGRHLERHAAR